MQHHPIRQKLLSLVKDQGFLPLKYREICRKIGEKYPQTVKHHIDSLLRSGLLKERSEKLFLIVSSQNSKQQFVNIPLYGLANCGSPTAFADDTVEGYVKFNRSSLPRTSVKNLLLVRASGNSMNKPEKKEMPSIDNDDLVLIDTQNKGGVGDYLLCVIDDCATIKRLKKNSYGQIMLVAESTDDYLPIIIGEGDRSYVAGKVVDVIKRV